MNLYLNSLYVNVTALEKRLLLGFISLRVERVHTHIKVGTCRMELARGDYQSTMLGIPVST